MDMKIDIFSDVACPWCYIGKRRLEQALDGFAHRDQVEIEWKSFELAPQLPSVTNLTPAQYMTKSKGVAPARLEAMTAHMTQLAVAEGLDMRMDKAKLFNTRKAHQLLHYAKTVGKQSELKEKLFRASFTEGSQLGDPDVLIELAGEIGIDRAAAKEVLDSGRYLQAVLDDEKQAQALGAHGIPFFIVNGKAALSGAQSSETFSRMLETAWQDEHPVETLPDPDGTGFCGIDGCA
jgi:predicted DsbA family dithiol-disulfide isomerase